VDTRIYRFAGVGSSGVRQLGGRGVNGPVLGCASRAPSGGSGVVPQLDVVVDANASRAAHDPLNRVVPDDDVAPLPAPHRLGVLRVCRQRVVLATVLEHHPLASLADLTRTRRSVPHRSILLHRSGLQEKVGVDAHAARNRLVSPRPGAPSAASSRPRGRHQAAHPHDPPHARAQTTGTQPLIIGCLSRVLPVARTHDHRQSASSPTPSATAVQTARSNPWRASARPP
jgi:hypothetical protein